jgi:hypothetical protein
MVSVRLAGVGPPVIVYVIEILSGVDVAVSLVTVDGAPVFGQGDTAAAPLVLHDVVPGVIETEIASDEPFGPGTVNVGSVTALVI